MKKFLIGLSLLALTSIVSAADFFGSGNNGEWKNGPYGPYWESNDWPEWTPMYWMQEMADSFGNNNDNNYGGWNMPFFGNGSSFGGVMPFGNGSNFGGMPFFGNNPYGGMPYGYGAPMPYPYPQPMMPYGAPMPYGAAPAPMPAPVPMTTAPGPATTNAQ